MVGKYNKVAGIRSLPEGLHIRDIRKKDKKKESTSGSRIYCLLFISEKEI